MLMRILETLLLFPDLIVKLFLYISLKFLKRLCLCQALSTLNYLMTKRLCSTILIASILPWLLRIYIAIRCAKVNFLVKTGNQI